MKTLIKLSIVAVLVTVGTESFAQTFGVKAGLNLSKFLIKDDLGNYTDDFKMNPGFHFGPTVEFSIDKTFSFESGLLLSTKGYKFNAKETVIGETHAFKQKISTYYLDIPLTAKATFDTGSAKIYGIFGPYLGMGLSGKVKSEFPENGEIRKEEKNISFGSDQNEGDYKRFDYGLTAGLGIVLNPIQIAINYNLGLANISNATEYGLKVKNRVLGISWL